MLLGHPGMGQECTKSGPGSHHLPSPLRDREAELRLVNVTIVNVTRLYPKGSPGGDSGKESACQCRRRKRRGFDPWVRKIPWRRKWQPTLVFLPGAFHGQRSLVGYNPRGHKRQQQQTKSDNRPSVRMSPGDSEWTLRLRNPRPLCVVRRIKGSGGHPLPTLPTSH